MRCAVDGNERGCVGGGRKGFADKTVWHGVRDADGWVWAFELRGGEVDGLGLCAAANDLGAGRVVAFDHDFDDLIEVATVVSALNLALAIVEDAESGMLSAMWMAVVLGRGENLKAKMASYLTASMRVMVSSKSASVSPGKPT